MKEGDEYSLETKHRLRHRLGGDAVGDIFDQNEFAIVAPSSSSDLSCKLQWSEISTIELKGDLAAKFPSDDRRELGGEIHRKDHRLDPGEQIVEVVEICSGSGSLCFCRRGLSLRALRLLFNCGSLFSFLVVFLSIYGN